MHAAMSKEHFSTNIVIASNAWMQQALAERTD